MTRKNRWVAGAVAVTVGVAGLWIFRNADASEGPAYRFATVSRGDLESTVSATGALSAVTTVQVGTQVSGQVAQIHVDFNDRVKKGQLLARIDPTLQQQAVLDAQAGLQRAQAELQRTREEYDRNKSLFDAKVLTATEFNTAQYNYTVAQASVKSAQVSLDRARKNLGYTEIHAPIDGVVVERNVDVGQTVAASLSAPQLFLIANNLSEMQILASVDESDIGQIAEGQEARFTVQAYTNRPFTGTVRQVRLQSATTENVVNYTVVVSVKNPDGKLLPGMTATVSFVTGKAEDVLSVPNAALRFRATPEMLADAGITGTAGDGSATSRVNGARTDTTTASAGARDSLRPRGATVTGDGAARTGTAQRAGGSGRASMAQLWYIGENGKPAVMRVRTGLTDGQNTEVSAGALREGMQVIIGTAIAAAPSTSAASPFQQQQQQRGPRPGGF